MALITKLVGVMIIMGFITSILFVIFGQITVRKLRKNPKTKDAMGAEFTSGWDILNVASALSRPDWLNNRYKKSKLYFMVADSDILYENTTKFDRVMARVFWISYVITSVFGISVLIFNWLGFFD